MGNEKKIYHLLHTAKPLRVKETDNGALKWLGAVVKNVDDPVEKVDFRPSKLELKEDENWSSLLYNDFEASVMRKVSLSLKLKLANILELSLDNSGEVARTAAKKKVVMYTLMDYDKILNKILDIDGYRDELLPELSGWTTTRWFVTGYLVAVPVASEEKEADEEAPHDADEAPAQGGSTTVDNTTKVEASVNPAAAVAAAGGALPIDAEAKLALDRQKHAVVKGEAVEAHIFAVAFKGIKKGKRGKAFTLIDGPQSEGDFGDGGDGSQQQEAAEEEDVVVLDPTPMDQELNAMQDAKADAGEEADEYYEKEAVEDLEFANKEEAAKFEELFGGVEFVYKETL